VRGLPTTLPGRGVPDRVSNQQTWFDSAPENGQQFKELVGRLRDTPERNYMDREVVGATTDADGGAAQSKLLLEVPSCRAVPRTRNLRAA
jgi:hypothetical protein